MAGGRDNLIPFSERSKDEARANGAKGGRKSGENRRKKRDLKNMMKMLLSLPVSDIEAWNDIAAMGVDADNIDNLAAITCALVKKASEGDVPAFKEIRNLIGEDNDTERLKLQQKEFKLKKEQMSGSDTNASDNNLLDVLKQSAEAINNDALD